MDGAKALNPAEGQPPEGARLTGGGDSRRRRGQRDGGGEQRAGAAPRGSRGKQALHGRRPGQHALTPWWSWGFPVPG